MMLPCNTVNKNQYKYKNNPQTFYNNMFEGYFIDVAALYLIHLATHLFKAFLHTDLG